FVGGATIALEAASRQLSASCQGRTAPNRRRLGSTSALTAVRADLIERDERILQRDRAIGGARSPWLAGQGTRSTVVLSSVRDSVGVEIGVVAHAVRVGRASAHRADV